MKISGFEIISIEQFEYCNKVNEHEMCRFVCYARDKYVDSLLKLCDSDCKIEDELFSFEGRITDISFSRDISGNRIEVKVMGKTYLLCEEVHRRIFQNPEKTLSDILSKIESMSCIKHTGQHDQVIEGIIIQDNISDWDFLKSLAQILGEKLFSGDSLFISSYGTEHFELTEEECIDYMFSVGRKESHLSCRLNKNLSIGSVIDFKGKTFVIVCKKYVLDASTYFFEYELDEKKDIKNKPIITNEGLLEAIVKDNNDPNKTGKIKVSFSSSTMEDCMEEDSAWIERESFYSSKSYGEVFIPAINDKVVVSIKNGKAYIIGSLRTEPYNEVYQSQNNKYLIFDDQVFFEYKKGIIAVTNNTNNISLSDKQIAIKLGDKTQMLIESGKTSVQIDKTTIEITGDISGASGKIMIEAKNEASISAQSVNIKGKSKVSIN